MDSPSPSVRLWDPLIRLFHWSLAGAFVANYFFTEEGDDWHQWIGYYAAAWLAIRLAWGFLGPASARWSDFWPTRARLGEHCRALRAGQRYHRLGHSPLGALVMLLMMGLMAGLAVTGFLMQEVDYFWGADGPLLVHETFANLLLGLAILHVLAALYESVQLRENLVMSMITGKRRRL
ncbi:cytochrome b/b6 domain-containing protein [Stutzerimonas urumqiensis]|uniref:cytochrome b/b6 domain-containing protein n=1 Tax=Stutzerimonas urumqiensis TaxID=638269 RepID=UPI000EB090DE|nr:cytochrome b/b6 domain-containing protein [Stutzerimonas urumqiensis]